VVIPVLGHIPGFYAVASAALALLFCGLRLLIWSVREILDLLRDLRKFRRGN
jgi:hypothetical protein